MSNNRRSLEETKELLTSRLVASPSAAADARASAPPRASVVPPKPTTPPKAAFLARAMKAEWPLKEADGDG